MHIEFLQKDGKIFLCYQPDYGYEEIAARLGISFGDQGEVIKYTLESLPQDYECLRPTSQDDLSLRIKKVFYLRQDDLITQYTNPDRFTFEFATACGGEMAGCWHISKSVFEINQDVYLSTDFKLDWRLFCVGYNNWTSVLRKISSILSADEKEIIIGGEHGCAIPIEVYESLIHDFPATSELRKYGDAQIQRYIQDYFETKKDFCGCYEQRYKKKRALKFEHATLKSAQFDAKRSVIIQQAWQQLNGLLTQ